MIECNELNLMRFDSLETIRRNKKHGTLKKTNEDHGWQ